MRANYMKLEIAAIAKAVLAGHLDLIDGALEIERIRAELGKSAYEPLERLRGFATEIADYPHRPEQRAVWADEALAKFDEVTLPCIALMRTEILDGLRAIVRDFPAQSGDGNVIF
jgi:hypothetical protein